jgi:hypothetical protein
MGRVRVRSANLKAKEMITKPMMKQPIRQAYNKAQSESEYWKAEADRWREVALLQDAQIETIMAKLEHRMRKIESGIRELQ